MAQRNILIITLGETPALVTETVWALLQRKERFVPDEIHLVTTAAGRRQLLDRIMIPDGPLAALLASEGLPSITQIVHLPRDGVGREMADIRTEGENIAFANTLTRLIKALTDDDNTRLHVSMAGGRKTMSAYASLAISLFGRDRDELSHVLVEPETFERAEEFFWPGQLTPAWDRDGIRLSPSDATIHLVDTPFVRLRHLLRNVSAFPGGKPDYGRIVDAVRAAIREPRVRLVVAERTLEIDGFEPLQLGHLEFSLYQLLATAHLEKWQGAGPDGVGPDHSGWLTYDLLFDFRKDYWRRFFKMYDDLFVRGVTRTEDMRVALEAAIRAKHERDDPRQLVELLRNTFQPMKSNLIAAISEGFPNPSIATAINITTVRRPISRFGLTLPAERLEIVPRD